MLIFLFVIIGLSILILGHEVGHFLAARFFNLKIDEFGFGFPPRIFAWRPKRKIKDGVLEPNRFSEDETEYSFNWLPFGGFVKIAGEHDHTAQPGETNQEDTKRLFSAQPAWKQSIIIVSGVLCNFLLGWLLITAIFLIGIPPAIVITDIEPASPAATAGIQKGDVFKDFTHGDIFLSFVQEHRGVPTTLHVLRDGKDIVFSLIPRLEVHENQGALGIRFVEAGRPREPLFAAILHGLRTTSEIFWFTVVGLYELLRGIILHGSFAEEVVGPVGIFAMAAQAGGIGFIYLVQLLALISINLAVVNLLPFPALDGGRLVMIMIEKIKGAPLSRKTETFVNTFGFAILILLMIIVTIRDVGRL